MAYSFLAQGSQADNSSNTSLTDTGVVYTAGDYVIWWLTYGAGSTISTTLTDGTNTYTRVPDPGNGTNDYLDPTNGQSWALYYNSNVAAGTFSVAYGLGSAQFSRGMGYLRYSGLQSVAPKVVWTNNNAPGNGANAVVSGNVGQTVQPGVLIGLCMDDSGGESSIAAGSGFTGRGNLAAWDSNIGILTRTEDIRITSLAAAQAQFTAGSGAGRFGTFGIFIPEPGASGGSSFPPVPSPLNPLVSLIAHP